MKKESGKMKKNYIENEKKKQRLEGNNQITQGKEGK